MDYQEQFFGQLKKAQEVINQANAEKTKVIDNFLEDITEICNIFYELWQEKEEDIKSALKKIEQKYNFKFPYDYNDSLNKDRIIRDICEKFPVYNYAEEDIIDSLPNTNEQWHIRNLSTKELIKIDVQPYNQNSRYAQDPEENQESFYYIMPTQLHDQLLKSDNTLKTTLIEEYMDKTINEFVNEIEEKVQLKADIVKKTMDKIDFNDPAIVAELRNKLKM